MSGGVERTVDYVGIGTLFVGVVILVVAALAWRSAQRAVQLAEQRQDYLLEEQERMKFWREENKSLQEELERERKESQSLQEALKRERHERLRAQHSAEFAQQEALREVTQQLRGRMDTYLKELEDNRSGIRRVK